ncbi:class III signal peptide-containing protein [uncultured Methanobrevibacter sp.]|uniref:class III signal peptide-containing protein n=1 Tax=uncultured Methanobrevibacter sp. TaxID=253161 RepID=UPI0025EBD273|nr:class III signal peptide-containing protein [uncultured Methanobrevibacter sp.]
MNKIKNKIKKLINETDGQGASEYILLFGGVIIIAIAALLIYRNYFQTLTLSSTSDVEQLRTNLTSRG